MMTFKELREQSGMNMKQFAAHFEIPYRTIQNWEAGVNKCPEYLLKLMKFRMDQEKPVECDMCKAIQHIHIFDSQMDCFITDQMECCPHCGRKVERGGEDGNL